MQDNKKHLNLKKLKIFAKKWDTIFLYHTVFALSSMMDLFKAEAEECGLELDYTGAFAEAYPTVDVNEQFEPCSFTNVRNIRLLGNLVLSKLCALPNITDRDGWWFANALRRISELADKYDTVSINPSNNIIGFNLSDEEYGCFSNLYLSDFEYAGKKFSSVEQFMTYHKVLMAQDYKLAEKILSITDSKKIRELGSEKYFADYEKIRDIWTKYSHIIVRRSIRAKFLQDIKLLAKLLLTGNSLLTECSEDDKIWNNGISIKNPNWKDVRLWTGSNMTGRILMEVRKEFLDIQSQHITPGYINVLPLFCEEDTEYFYDFYDWALTPAVAARNPFYHNIIYAYVSTLSQTEKDAFINGDKSFATWQNEMQNNASCKLKTEGFFEMKQDMFDTLRMNYRYI